MLTQSETRTASYIVFIFVDEDDKYDTGILVEDFIHTICTKLFA